MTGSWSLNDKNDCLTMINIDLKKVSPSIDLEQGQQITTRFLNYGIIKKSKGFKHISLKQTDIIENLNNRFKKTIYFLIDLANVNKLEMQTVEYINLKLLKSKKEDEIKQINNKLLNLKQQRNGLFRTNNHDDDNIFELYEQLILLEQQLITINNVLK